MDDVNCVHNVKKALQYVCDTLGNSGFQVFQVNVVYYKN